MSVMRRRVGSALAPAAATLMQGMPLLWQATSSATCRLHAALSSAGTGTRCGCGRPVCAVGGDAQKCYPLPSTVLSCTRVQVCIRLHNLYTNHILYYTRIALDNISGCNTGAVLLPHTSRWGAWPVGGSVVGRPSNPPSDKTPR
jgi:hypothetical protein